MSIMVIFYYQLFHFKLLTKLIQMSEFPKKYNPKEFEQKLYQNWETNGLFKPRESRTGEQFYIPIPPPNVTGVLHLGHALTSTLQDIMTRYHINIHSAECTKDDFKVVKSIIKRDYPHLLYFN